MCCFTRGERRATRSRRATKGYHVNHRKVVMYGYYGWNCGIKLATFLANNTIASIYARDTIILKTDANNLKEARTKQHTKYQINTLKTTIKQCLNA